MSAITAKARRKMKKYAVLTREPRCFLGSFDFSWEQRKLGEVGTTYTGLSGKTKEDFGHGNGQFVTYMNVFSNPVGLPDMTEAVEIDDSQNKVLLEMCYLPHHQKHLKKSECPLYGLKTLKIPT